MMGHRRGRMNRYIAAVLLGMICLLPSTVWGQFPGAQNGVVQTGPAAPAGRVLETFMARASSIHAARGLVPSFGAGSFQLPIVIAQPFFGYSPFVSGWPAPIYPAPIYPTPLYPAAAYVEPQAAPAVSQNEINLAYQLGQLSQEVQQLRKQQAAQQSPQLSPRTSEVPASAPPALTPTLLVFRDGHRLEIQNYAIVGQSLWVLDEPRSTKILLSDLDIMATQNENPWFHLSAK